MKANDVDTDHVTCKNSKWSGKKSALLQHLRMKSDCKSTYNLKRIKAEHTELKKRKKRAYDALHYAHNKDKKKQYYQERREERTSYQRNYDEKNKEEKQLYYQENREERLQYQRKYDEAHKERKKEYRRLKAHYQKYNMERTFQECDIAHFKSHIEGRCGWDHYYSSHEYCWEEIEKQCTTCHENLFKIKCQGRCNKPYKLNSLHCLNGCQVTCHLCGEFIIDFKYYLHFYVKGVNSDLREKAILCPFRTYLENENEKVNYTPCEICSNNEIQEKNKECIEKIGVKYRYFVDEKTFEVTSIMTNCGRDILKCPFVGEDVQSTICLIDAIQKLGKKVNAGIRWDNPEYTEPCLELDSRISRHKTEFDLMCKLKKHIDLHTSERVETHVVELTLVKPYTSPSDLEIIDTLIKTNMENFEQISKIKAIIPASKCLGLRDHYRKRGDHQEPWLAYVDPKHITYPVPRYQWDMKRSDGKLLTPTEELHKLEENLATITKEMKEMIQDNKTLFVVIHTHEGVLEEPTEFFEDLSIFPEWVTESKLLFTWSVKSILEEKHKPVQKSLIEGDFIQSKKYPSYLMCPILSNLCDCDCCPRGDIGAINEYSTVPVNGCSLPMKRSPLHAVNSRKDSKLELWRAMFNFAWKILQPSNDSDSSITSDSESNNEKSGNENTDIEEEEEEDSEYCDDL